MATRNTVTDEYVVRASISDGATPGLEKLTASLGAADKAADSLRDKAANVGAAIADSGARFSTATTQFDQIAKRYDDVTKLSLQLTAAQNELTRAQTSGQTALAAGTTTQEAYAATIAGIVEKINRLAAAQGDARASAEALAESTARWNGIATEGASAISAFAGQVSSAAEATKASQIAFSAWLAQGQQNDQAINKFNTNLKGYLATTEYFTEEQKQLAAVTTASFQALDGFDSRITSLKAKFDPLFAATQTYNRSLAELAELEQEGSTSASVLAAAQAKVAETFNNALNPEVLDTTKKVENLAAAHNQASFATRQLGVQTVQFTTMVATGSPILLAAIQQGHQLVDVALATGTGFEVVTNGVKSAWSAISSFVTTNPMLVALLALTAASTALVAVEQSRASELNDLQQKIRGVTDDYQAMGIAALNAAHAIASTSNLSLSDAKVGTAAFAAAPGIAQIGTPDSAAFAALVKTSADASVALGISVPEAEKKFAAAIQDAGSLVSEFTSKGLFGMNAEFERSIKNQIASGDSLGAFQRVMDQVNSKTRDALQPATDLGKSWEALKNAFTGASGGAESLSSVLGNALSAMAQTSLRILREIVNAVNWARGVLTEKDTAATPSAAASATNNGILTSSAGALGLGQVMPGTAAQFGLDPTVAAQNIKAAYLYQDQLAAMKNRAGVTMFPSQTAVDGAYNAGPGRTNPAQAATYAAALAKVNAADLPADTAALIQSVGEALGKTQGVIDHMKTLVMAESSGNQFYKGVGLSPPGGSAATAAPSTPSLTPDQQAINSATKQAIAGGTPAFNIDAATAQVENMQKGLAALGRAGVTSGTQFDAFTQELQRSQLALQNAIPATDAQGQAINREVAAAEAMTAAYAKGLPAVELQTARNLALTQVNSSLARGTDAYKIEVEKLTQANLANAEAHGSEQSAATLAATQRQTESIKAVTAAIAAGLPEQARAIAAQAAKNSVEATGLVSGEAYTKAVQAQTEANLAAAQSTGTQQIELQVTALDRATAASLRVANAYKVSEAAGAAMEARVQAETAANAAGLAGTDAWTASVEKNTAAILAGAAADAQKALALGNIPLDKSIVANNAMADAYAKGEAAVGLLTAKETAEAQLVSTKLLPGTIAYNLALAERTQKNLAVAASAEKVQGAQDSHALENSITMIQAETATLGMNSDQRTLLLSHMQSELELRDKYKTSYDTVGVKILGERDQLAALTLAYQNTQTNLSYVSGQFTQAFDTIGNAMSQAFISGQGAAVNWGNVMTAVVQQVIQQFLKLAVLNPIINSLFNQSNPTLGSVAAAIGSVGGGAGSSSTSMPSFLDTLGYGSTLSSVSGSLGGPTIMSTLGLNGSGIGTSLTGLMNTSLYGGSMYGPTLSAEAASSMGLAPGVGATAPMAGGATLGSFAGGIGGGFAAGSLIGGLIQSGLNKAGPAPTIGAGVGAVGGSLIGTLVLPGVGTVLGGLLGGVLGGAGGGLIGPHVANTYSSQGLAISNGQFVTGTRLAQRDENAGAEQAQAVADTNAMNAFLATNKLILTSLGAITQLGDNTPGGFQDPSKAANLAAAFPNFRFSSSDPIEADKLAGKSFASSDELQSWVAQFNAVQASAKAFLTDTAAVLKDLGATSGSLPDSIKAITSAYDTDKTTMDGLIASGDLSTQQTIDLTKAETDLATVRDKSIQQLQDQVAAHYASVDAGFTARQLTATASMSGNPTDALNTQLYTFDTNAPTQRAALKADLVSIYGDTVTTTETFAQQMALLETTLGQERLAIVANYTAQMKTANDAVIANDNSLLGRDLAAVAALTGNPADVLKSQLYSFDVSAQQQRDALSKQLIDTYGATVVSTKAYTGRMAELEKVLGEERLEVATQANKALTAQASSAAASAIAALVNWTSGLATSAASPLSPFAKLQSAQNAFDANTAKANAGDAAAVQTLQTTGAALLSAAQSYYGSSSGYTAVFQNVVTELQKLSATPSDALTASFLALQTQTQTQTLVAALASLQAEVTRLRSDVNRNGGMPARLAA